jgi:DNA-binding MarR family transcriptional regulator
MFLLGAGLGFIMQVLILAVQNAVDYELLGVATSGATLFRTIGGSLGTAILGAVFTGQLTKNLKSAFPHGGSGAASRVSSGGVDPSQVASLPAAVRGPYLQAFTDSLGVVFTVAAGVAVVAFLLSWLIEERPLRKTVSTDGVGEAFAAPKPADSLHDIGLALSRLAGRDRTRQFVARVAASAGVDLSPAACWMLFRYREDGTRTIADLQALRDIPTERLEHGRSQLLDCGYVEVSTEDAVTVVTPGGDAIAEQLRAEAREQLVALLEGWSPEQYPDLERLLSRLADDIAGAPPQREREAVRG